MSYRATGSVKHILEKVTGNGKNGRWQKQDIVIEIPGDYPKDIALTVWGEKVDNIVDNLTRGTQVDVKFDIESKEHNGRWYTNTKCFFVKTVGEPQNQQNDFPF